MQSQLYDAAICTFIWSYKSALALAEKSVDHWIGMGSSLTGFCRPAVSVMSTLMGRRRSAFTNVSNEVPRERVWYLLLTSSDEYIHRLRTCLTNISYSTHFITKERMESAERHRQWPPVRYKT